MPARFIEKYKSNLEFLTTLNEKLPNGYLDWKITVVFYCSLHLLKAYTKLKYRLEFSNHSDMRRNADSRNRGATAPLPVNVYNAYEELYSLSRNARYEVVYAKTPQLQEGLMLYNLKCAMQYKEILEVHFTQEGLKY